MKALVLTVTAVVFCLALFHIGFLTARIRLGNAIFDPWLTSQRTTHGPLYWLRARDYAAAWSAYHKADLPWMRMAVREPDATFASELEYPIEVSYGPDALDQIVRKSHGSTTSARLVS